MQGKSLIKEFFMFIKNYTLNPYITALDNEANL